MYYTNNILVLAFVLAAVIAYLSTPLVIRFAKKIGIVDDPKKHKHPKVIHTYPVPRGGGIATYIAVLVPAMLLLPIDKHQLSHHRYLLWVVPLMHDHRD